MLEYTNAFDTQINKFFALKTATTPGVAAKCESPAPSGVFVRKLHGHNI